MVHTALASANWWAQVSQFCCHPVKFHSHLPSLHLDSLLPSLAAVWLETVTSLLPFLLWAVLYLLLQVPGCWWAWGEPENDVERNIIYLYCSNEPRMRNGIDTVMWAGERWLQGTERGNCVLHILDYQLYQQDYMLLMVFLMPSYLAIYASLFIFTNYDYYYFQACRKLRLTWPKGTNQPGVCLELSEVLTMPSKKSVTKWGFLSG